MLRVYRRVCWRSSHTPTIDPPGMSCPSASSSSGIARGYVERLDPEWGPELTSTELMDRLKGRSPEGAVLATEMRTAEAVKFGRLRPHAEPTAEHLTVLRAWLAGRGEVRS